MEINNCNFTGIEWDESANESIYKVASALMVNASALKNLTELFKAQNISIDTMFKVNLPQDEVFNAIKDIVKDTSEEDCGCKD